MKFLFILLILFFYEKCFSQDLIIYNDTTNHFSIALPIGWKYQSYSDKVQLKLNVFRIKENENDIPKESYNVIVLPFPGSNIDSAYTDMIRTISARVGFKTIRSYGDTIIEAKKYKWVIESHSNWKTLEDMTSLIYLGYKDGAAYMITYATISISFARFEPLFRRISSTFRL